ncbi:lipopolysaccharide assembly protein LapA domain-containing protein [Kordiimonas marina]|uniref:lipopolysaccharide assembly protein LapA domain-containing protein n=1 Tax=Kordiimonas marina TaxID=2872312 RepID=UPI001FF0F216|nr:LapA family protein [Kordiimonas marina]MCJ9427813.1 LapA family protein [Kordiimonas marina]
MKMSKVKYSLASVAGGLLVLFAAQNMATIEVNFLFWSFYTRRFAVIIFAVLVGLIIGWALSGRKKGKDKEEPKS